MNSIVFLNRQRISLFLYFIFSFFTVPAQSGLEETVYAYFQSYKITGYVPSNAMRADSVNVNDSLHTVTVYVNEAFSSQPFTPQNVKNIYTRLQHILPTPYNAYRLTILSKQLQPIEDLIPNILREDNEDKSRLWGDIDYNGYPWVRNTSLPYQVKSGLQGRHLFIWPSHGRYFKGNSWHWQRPYLYCTTEDIFTQSFVFPYLFPMLEKAGAIVCSPRERDYQTCEAVIDNDFPNRQGLYTEIGQDDAVWSGSNEGDGFAPSDSLLCDSMMPFRMGTWRSIRTVNRHSRLATATWQPDIPQSGRYAVYVSYATRPNSIPDAHYTVFHRGGRTTFQVNQQMGGGTWLYLGTFEFDKGNNPNGRVVLSNQSNYRGVITADAVRFGGGMGQTERGEIGASGLPRFLEAARYYTQWAGVPDSLYNTSNSENDYNDDLRCRSNMLNWLAAGSCYLPNRVGGRVPFELALALHSDAGIRYDGNIYGTLGISTTLDGEGNDHYLSGLSRRASSDFAAMLLNAIVTDLSSIFHIQWTQRELWDRNYAETRMPAVPSAILEMLSHQNFADMKMGHDPHFKFALARSIYKTILRFVNHEHGVKKIVVQPLPPTSFSALLTDDGTNVCLSWKPQIDSLETSAIPSGYILYTRYLGEDFDNGQAIGNVTSLTLPLKQGVQVAFRITAVNEGGESFPSETLSVFSAGKKSKQVLIVNGFTRLSGPAWVEQGDSLGFDLDKDIGVPYLSTTAFSGRQTDFVNREKENNSGRELIGQEITGNTFDYPSVHGAAIATVNGWSYSSTSLDAFSQVDFQTKNYQVIDYIAGLQSDKVYNLRSYEVFPKTICNKLRNYLQSGGSLFVSGSFIGSDNCVKEEKKRFIEDVLHYSYDGTARYDSTDCVKGLNINMEIYRIPCREHYALQAPDALWPVGNNAFSAFAYGGGQCAGVAYQGTNYRTIATGFPFECIKDQFKRNQAMKAILQFLAQ